MSKFVVTLDRIEGEYGVLVTSKKEEILWPRHLLPNQKPGSVFNLIITYDKKAKADSENEARSLIDEITDQEGENDKK